MECKMHRAITLYRTSNLLVSCHDQMHREIDGIASRNLKETRELYIRIDMIVWYYALCGAH